jgi:competence protein ComEC
LGQVVAYVSWPFVAYTIRMVEWFAQFSGGVIVFGELSWIWIIAFYALLFAVTAWGKEIREKFSNIRPVVVFSGLVVVVSLVWQAALSAPDGKLHVTVLDVGTGSAILIQTPQGRYVLVDGGPSARRLSDGVGRRLPLFHRELDLIVVASPLEEHVAGLPPVIERFPIGEVLWAGAPNLSREARYLEETLVDVGVPVNTAQIGQVVDLGEGAWLEVLTVGERGATLLLVWNNFRMVLPLGADFDALDSLNIGKAVGPVTALLLADSGYAPVNPPEWIENLHPQLVLLSVDAGDYQGLPSPETLEAVKGYTLLRTDLNGWIHLRTDGEQLWVNVERGD